jgi:hypothetical protein
MQRFVIASAQSNQNRAWLLDCFVALRAPRNDGDQATPSFFCRLVDEVVYWNTNRLSGKT